ncbi:optic atrophy 3 protein [Populus alba x Populus x berolinensis]|uniref:Optic atrophy 3 protein n=1 Tax=Populus alba x Populus x berolinensis TaxID=444605 RepID=A0AAD6Q2T9_9ROSI|nr:optic atrophy 3 protein [Populus alba x Populus x berolinensis]
MILPVVKLGTLALKTFCKPIANRLKKEAGLHPKFRHFIINMAQANHRFTTKMQRRIYGHSVDAVIRPLDEEKAVQAAADLIGEFFVFSVAGAAVIFEVQRSSRSEARKEEKQRQEIEAMMQRDEELAKEIQAILCSSNSLFAFTEPRQWSRTEYFVQRLQLTRAARHQVLMKFPILKSTESYTSGSRPICG